ncbi:hypothetical protein DL96DRAFT_1782281 [Flagelloscypha sp. PMI_526]|nr:hypothetical protein DL96DRAFT_1782281 [Flagelloscypha sp. PMI_526]
MSFAQGPTDVDLLNEARSNPELMRMFRMKLINKYQPDHLTACLDGRNLLDDRAIVEVFEKKLVKWMRKQRAMLHQTGPPVAPTSNPALSFPSSHGFLGQPSTYQPLQARPLPIRAFNAAPPSLDTHNVNALRTGRFNPRSVSDTAAQSAGNYHQRRGQRMPFSGNQGQQLPASPHQEVIAVILPLRCEESPEDHLDNQENDAPVNYKFRTSSFKHLYQRLKTAGLTVPISVPTNGIIPHLDVLQTVTVALVEAGFEIPGYPDFKTSEDVRFATPLGYHETWYTRAKINKSGNSPYSSVTLDSVVPARFTYVHIKKHHPQNPSDMRPDGSPPPILLLLVPRTGNLRRSLSEFSTRMDVPNPEKTHACYGYHLLKALHIWHGSAFDDDNITCERSCPQATRGAPPASRMSTPPLVIGQPRPHPSPQTTRSVRARTGPSPERHIPHQIAPPPAPSVLPASSQRASSAPFFQPNALEQGLVRWPDMTSTRQNIPTALLFRSFLKGVQARIVPETIQVITVPQVKDIEEVIMRILNLHVKMHTLEELELPQGAYYQQNGPMLIQHLFQKGTHFTVGGQGSVTAGLSPTLDVLTRLLRDLTANSGRWTNGPNGSTYKIPVFEMMGLEPSDLRESFEQVGIAAAWYISRYGMALLPISPLMIFALASSSEEEVTSIPHATIALLDPAAFTTLADILSWKFVLNKDPANICMKFDDEGLYKQFMLICWNRALFGVDNLFNHPIFQALRKGFRLSLNCSESGYETSVPEMLRRVERGLDLRRNILFLYNRLPEDVREVLPNVKCRPFSKDPHVLIYAAILELRLRQYLLRSGHPEALKEVVGLSEEDWEKAKSDSTLRWRMFMVASTASSQIPLDDKWVVKIKVLSPSEDDNKQKEAIPINFHSCFGNGDVVLTLPMKKILLDRQSSTQEEDLDGTFDRWLHSQLWMHATGTAFFNRV